jgi:hypothetical protein
MRHFPLNPKFTSYRPNISLKTLAPRTNHQTSRNFLYRDSYRRVATARRASQTSYPQSPSVRSPSITNSVLPVMLAMLILSVLLLMMMPALASMILQVIIRIAHILMILVRTLVEVPNMYRPGITNHPVDLGSALNILVLLDNLPVHLAGLEVLFVVPVVPCFEVGALAWGSDDAVYGRGRRLK